MYLPLPTRTSRLAFRGLTLIEMLIGMAITLVMMAAVVNLFANIGAGIRVRQAGMEMGGQLRTARARLFKDLAGATCDGIPKSTPGDDDKADGYIEIVEGQWSDKNPSTLTDGTNSGVTSTNPELDYSTSLVPSGGDPATGAVTNGRGLGDYDDILALTVRSEREPFVGRHLVLRPGGIPTNPNDWIYETIESHLAEVLWFVVENPIDGSLGEPGMRTVYRRVLLIAPWLSPIDLAAVPTTGGVFMLPGNASRFYQRFDISARYDATAAKWIPNALSDLTKRENRFAHFFDNTLLDNGFPHLLRQGAISPPNAVSPAYPTGSLSPLHPLGEPWFPLDPGFDDPDRQGEDVMLNNVLAFDVRVYEPGAPIVTAATGAPLEPSDFGWYVPGALVNILGYGSYVDLGWAPFYPSAALAANVPTVTFQGQRQAGWHPNNPTLLTGYPAVYDTWSFHYENDGIDQDGGATDQGTDGFDTDGINGTDDIGERETAPPYDVPLRGIQVKLRIYEPDSRQIREATVTKGF